MKNDGRLTEESFAVAMHLINQVLAGKPLPDTIPVSLVPPSFRSGLGMLPALQQGPVVSETQRDLFGIFEEAAPASTPVQPQQVQSHQTGPVALQQQYTGANPSARPVFGMFPTSAAAPAPPMPAPASALQEPVMDLLGDDDEVIERTTHELSSTAAEIGNTQSQLNQTTTAYEGAKTEREKLEAELTSQAATLSQLQTQLASAKAGFEAESKLLATLKERYHAQLVDIQTTRTQLITAESDLSALKLEKTEVGTALLRDKDDVRELQKRQKEVLEEVGEIRKEVEKAKKDVRLQKGHLAIAKKQLASAEGDKTAAEKELQETREEAETTERELKEAEAELTERARSPSVGAGPVPGPAPEGSKSPSVRATSPAPSVLSTTSPASAPNAVLPFQDVSSVSLSSPISSKSNNPFERLALSRSNTNSPFQAASPPPAQPATIPDVADDDPFGFNVLPSVATIMPVKPVSPQNTGGMGAATPGSDPTLKVNASHAPQGSIAETDAFFTPPSSTRTERMEIQDSIVAAAVSQFPDLTEPGVPAPPVTADPANQADEPIDVHLPPLTEIKEADDSSDDSDEDEEAFQAARTAVKAELSLAAATSPAPATEPTAEPLQQLQPQASANTGAAAFDDLFGVSPATSNTATATGSDFSNISANPQQAPVAQNGSAFPTDNFMVSTTSAASPAPATGRCLYTSRRRNWMCSWA
jgi:epidermal growth factor receptor substrate 15